MTIQSRATLPYQCNQALHTWHKDCLPAAWMLAVPCVRESFKIYCVFYGVRRDCLDVLFDQHLLCADYRIIQITKNSNVERFSGFSSSINE